MRASIRTAGSSSFRRTLRPANGDTIVALATPPGRGAIAIVRVSGPQARAITARVFRSRRPLRDRYATRGSVLDIEGVALDDALALAFDAPRSATGEDVVELHVHGAPVVARETLRALIAAGARAAGPGEFTRRAFANGKLDLSAAEAVADLIDAESRAAARAARANLTGALARAIAAARETLADVLAQLAGAIDYPDEVPDPPRDVLAATIAAVDAQLAALSDDWERGRLVREGLALTIAGPPNAGKSSLLNGLLGEERAIVSEHAGTTRDAIEERLVVDDVVVRITDTAGLRTTGDPVERIGIERARRAIDAASLTLVVVDGSAPLDADARGVLTATRDRARIVFFSKADLGDAGFRARDIAEHDALHGVTWDATALAAIRSAIGQHVHDDHRVDVTRPHLAGTHHADAVARAREALAQAGTTLRSGNPVDLLAGDLLAASAALGEITGADAAEATLDRLFARFCIGK